MSKSKLNVWLFSWFFTNRAFVILPLMCNLNFHGVLTNITSCMSDQTKAVVSAGTVDGSFDHTWHLGKLNWFLYWLLWNKFANFFFLMSLLGSFARNVTWTSGLLLEFSCVIAVPQLSSRLHLRSYAFRRQFLLSCRQSSKFVVVVNLYISFCQVMM